MKQEPKKRLVSKGSFVQMIGLRMGMGLSGLTCLLLSVVCLIMTLFFLFTVHDDVYLDHRENFGVAWDIAKACFWGVGTCLLWKIGFSSVNKAQSMEVGVPLTRANIGDLPAPDSLVRASAEPEQEQQGVLLRAAMNSEQTPLEQLVRPSDGSEMAKP